MKVWGREVREVGSADVPELAGYEYVACQFAEMGAMGFHGGVFLINAGGDVFFTRRTEDPERPNTLTWEELVKVFPKMESYGNGMFGTLFCPDGYVYEYLGMGNHLLVKEELHGKFKKIAEIVIARDGGGILYNHWLEAILELVGKREGENTKQ